MRTRVVEVDLGNGTVALMQVTDAEVEEGEGAEKVGWQDRFDFTDVAETLSGIADALKSAVATAKPHTMTVELGLELAVKSGKLTGMLIEGSGKAALKVTLGWERGSAGG